ncbi:MAG: fibronectin type III domain-containing protein, partial [Spirochaetota bacterium]
MLSKISYFLCMMIPFRKRVFYLYAPVFRAFSLVILLCIPASAALTSVNLSAASPTMMSDGKGYYLAGQSYTFTVNALNSGATAFSGAGNYSEFRLRIPTSAGNLDFYTVTGTGAATVTTASYASATVTNNGVWTNLTVTYIVTFKWTVPAWSNSTRTVTGLVTANDGTVLSDTQSAAYGFASDISVVSFAQTGQAADGYISPSHATFDVSGVIVYDLPGTAQESASDYVNDGYISSASLILQTLGTTYSGLTRSSGAFTQTVPAAAITTPGGYRWYVSAVTSDGTETSMNSLNLECNEARVTGIVFTGGLGRGPTSAGDDYNVSYYRGYNLSGTNITLSAAMKSNGLAGNAAMRGDTAFNVHMTDGTSSYDFAVTIASGKSSATAEIPYSDTDVAANVGLEVASGSTVAWTYSVTSITGGVCTLAQTTDGNGTAVTESIYWDNADAPSSNALGAVTVTGILPAATSVTVYWTPIAYTGADADFYEYRIHFREASGQWKIWDGEDDSTLRWPASNLSQHIASGAKYTTIPNLKIFTDYEYYITAIDIFGNEITETNAGPLAAVRTFRTLPYSISVALSDGITGYQNASFADLTPSVRTLRTANIKVELSIIAAVEMPETVKVWYTTSASDASQDIVDVATQTVRTGAFSAAGIPLYSVVAEKTAPNKWAAYIPTSTGLLVNGAAIRFVVETEKNEIPAFSDSTSELTNPNPNNGEWTFCVAGTADFTPYPVKILNNVITSSNPLAYPAYYLTADAYVTIRIFDIKGRQVATILDDAFRR